LSLDFFAVFLFADLSRRAKSKKLKCQTGGRGGGAAGVRGAGNRTLIKFIYAALFRLYFIFVWIYF